MEERKVTLDEYKAVMQDSKDNNGKLSDEQVGIIALFHGTPEYQDYVKNQKLEFGDKKDIEKIITIGEDKITVDYKGWVTAPNKYSSFISESGNFQETLSNLYAAFGKNNVTEEIFKKGEGPTNAEHFEETTGKNFFRYVMSEGRLG